MQSNAKKLYYCHSCKKTVLINLPNLVCPQCNSDFLQEANMAEIEPQIPRELSFLDIVSIFAETRDPMERRNRIIARIFGQRQDSDENRPFQFVLRELMERSGRAVPASDETIMNITTVTVETAEPNECKICADTFLQGETKKILDCKHEFHSECLDPWLKIKNICPVCKEQI